MRITCGFVVLLGALLACTCEKVSAPGRLPPITTPFSETFERADLGPDWRATDSNAYRIEAGALAVRQAYNHPLWLERPLPRNATIEFDCWSESDAGDIKVEIWGDGKSHATDRGGYTSTAYNFIFGGWHNTLSVLARLNEHGADRQARQGPRVERGRHYHWTITRQGGHIDWLIDGQPFLAFDDPAPLEGVEHAYFAINDWEAELHFDNLKITPR
jgi:hypothetical protein